MERRIHERDTTLDLPAIALDLITRVRAFEVRIAEGRGALQRCQNEVADRDQRLERAQAENIRQAAVLAILRERMDADLATHHLARVALDAFDRGVIVIP